MAQPFRVVVSSPQTSASSAKTWTFTQDTGNVVEIECELKKEKHRISIMTVTLYDPKWSIFNSLPDPAFSVVPVQLYLPNPNSSIPSSSPVFDGKVTMLQPSWPAWDRLTLVCHDYSVDMRRQKKYRTFKNLTSLQIAQKIAADYNMNIFVESGAIVAAPRIIDIGMEISDWDHLARALAYDGLEVYTKGNQIRVRPIAQTAYGTTFQKGSPPVLSFRPSINHVGGPGKGGDNKGAVALENSGTYQAAQGTLASELGKENAGARSHRRPIGSPPATSTGSHAEDPGNQGWTNKAVPSKRRKDDATMECTLIADIMLANTATLAGWGAKCDGTWLVESIKHLLVTESGFQRTMLNLHRGSSPGGSNSAGIPFAL